MAMATATADTILTRSPSLLTAASGPGGGAVASAPASTTTANKCGADFLFPKNLDFFYHLDILTVSYRSTLANPTLSCWCGGQDGKAAVQKLSTRHASPFNGSARLQLNFSSTNAPCWFELTSESGDCGDVSDRFVVLTNQRPATGTSPIVSISTPVPVPAAPRRTTTTTGRQKHLQLRAETTSTAPTTVVSEPSEPQAGGDSLSSGAKAGIGIGISLICVAIVAVIAMVFFRRRRRGQDADHLGAIMDHERGKGRKPEKRSPGAPSIVSARSDEEALFPIQPVYDGFPGSMGYEDVRSLHSLTSHSHSPTNGHHSPTAPHQNSYWSPPQERSMEADELAAARLKSQHNTAIPPVISYGPNPVTPTLPRPTPRVIELERRTSPHSSPDSIAAVPVVPIMPIVPDFPEYPDYTGYNIPAPAPAAVPSRPSSIPEQLPHPHPSPPRHTVSPNVVTSYGPNRVTPTPQVVSPTVPPDDTMINRRYQEQTYHEPNYPEQQPPYQVPAIAEVSEQNHDRNDYHHHHHHERQFSWDESPLLGASSPVGGLPPYASQIEFEAMTKGAIRNMPEPQAGAELPPTKDGYYPEFHPMTQVELPGEAPQLPFQVYSVQQQDSSSGRRGAGAGAGAGAGMVVAEQKVLISADLFSDADMRLFMEQKAKAREKRRREMEMEKGEGTAEGR
ncbi:uncharacterized protein QC764_702850 [Podospora pseudoanserina]|uniref:Uncharacterized protein n=1 Tax=Podospora pseudoanserina TaxID=2609844 RepID=A0ABR0HJ80_9PEZI|nr:hypothetical protein QC764_702850 [Podospora pseudoanserina]